MKSSLPKVLHPLGGRTLVGHVLDTAATLDAGHVLAVVRFERDRIVEALQAEQSPVQVVDQDDVPGTGRAVAQAIDALPADFAGDVLVLSGDVPLLDNETLSALLSEHRAAHAAATC